MPERWIPVPGFEGLYEVSDRGALRSLDRIVAHPQGPQHRAGRVLLPYKNRTGYLVYSLNRDGVQYRMQAHRLVLLAFVGEAPDGFQACHGNAVRDDNTLSNLRWDSPRANAADRKAHGHEHNLNKTHCKYGHEFTPENTYVEKNRVHRKCLSCCRVRDRARRERKHA